MEVINVCARNAKSIRQCEQFAIGLWKELIRNSLCAQASHNSETAVECLKAAIKVALVREGCDNNKVIDASYVTKPLMRAIQIYIAEADIYMATHVLDDIAVIIHRIFAKPGRCYVDCLNKLYVLVAQAEKREFPETAHGQKSLFACPYSAQRVMH